MITERRFCDRKLVKNDDYMELEDLKNENEKLKEKVSKMTTIIQGMSYPQAKQGKPLNQMKKSTNGIKAQQVMDNQNERNELLAALNRCRNKITEQENEIQRLHAELYGPNKGGKLTGEYSKEVYYLVYLV